MQPDQAADLVAGILTRNQIPFSTREDGRQHRVLFGSTAIYINFVSWGDEEAVVNLAGVVLERLDTSEETRTKAVSHLNELNGKVYFGKFCLYDDVIRVEHDLAASHLQGDELMNALNVVASLSDNWDDQLQEELGGSTWEDVEQESSDEEEALET
jgi:hypothetical protein